MVFSSSGGSSEVIFDQRMLVHQRIDKRLTAITMARYRKDIEAWFLVTEDLYSEVHPYFNGDVQVSMSKNLSDIRGLLYDPLFVKLRLSGNLKAVATYNNKFNAIMIRLNAVQNLLMDEMKKEKMLLPMLKKADYGKKLVSEEEQYQRKN